LTGCSDDWTSGRGHLVVTQSTTDSLSFSHSPTIIYRHAPVNSVMSSKITIAYLMMMMMMMIARIVQLTVARCAVAVEAVGAVTEILADDILTRGSRRTLVPASSTLVDVCQHHDSARHAALLHRHTTQSAVAVGTYALSTALRH